MINIQKLFSTRIKLFILILLLIGVSGKFVKGQESAAKQIDTAIRNQATIPLGDIAIKSAELKIKTKLEIHDLIPTGTIRRLKEESAALLSSVDTKLLENIAPDDGSKNIRFLEGRIIELNIEQRKIKDQKAKLTEVVSYLDNFKYKLLDELNLWKATKDKMIKDSLTNSIPVILPETISYLDSVLSVISLKSSSVMEILDQTITIEVEIDTQIEKTNALISTKQSHVFRADHIPFFEMNFRTDYSQEIIDSFHQVSRVKFAELKRYIRAQLSSVFIALIVFCCLIYLFILIRKKIASHQTGYGYFYKEKLLRVLSHPVSAAILLTLFSTFFTFPDRQVIFREISFYIVAFPLVHILSILIEKKYNVYLYSFGVLIIFYMLLILFPNETVIYRFLLLFIATAEITLLSLFLANFDKKHELKKIQYRLITVFVFLLLSMAVVGFITNITGNIILTELILFAVFTTIYSGLVLGITTLLVNGLLVTGIDTVRGQRLNIFRIQGEGIKRKSIYLLNLVAVIYWITLMLRSFHLFDPIYNAISSFLTYKITLGSASFSLDSILIFLLVIYIGIVLSNLIRFVLEEDILNRFSLSKGLPHTIAMLVKYALITGGFFFAVNAAGIPVDKLTIILGAMSVGIGFGLQNIFNNLVSGLILLFERPIQLGDTVQVGQLTGNVKSIGIRASSIRTFEGAEVIVPNGQLVSNEVINWTLSDQNRRVEIIVGVSYDSDPKQVHSLLTGILNEHHDVLQKPSPMVFFKALGESSLDFTVFAWIADYNEGLRIKSELLFRIFEVLTENKIEIPFPQHDLHLRSVDPEILLRNRVENKNPE
jgi:potassium-dependent mechanosensitive channel